MALSRACRRPPPPRPRWRPAPARGSRTGRARPRGRRRACGEGAWPIYPWLTSKRYQRWRSRQPLGGQAYAGLESSEIMPDVGRLPPRRYQRAAMQIERMHHHQIVAQPEILHRQSGRVDQTSVARNHPGESAHAIGIARGVVGIAETKLAEARHIACLLYTSDA